MSDSFDWMVEKIEEDNARFRVTVPFGIKAIRIKESDVDGDLLEKAIENYMVSDVASGLFITHEQIEHHCELIEEHGLEAYLQKRLELVKSE